MDEEQLQELQRRHQAAGESGWQMGGGTAGLRAPAYTNNGTIPIIAMTASLLKSEINNCYDAGMNNYIPKPYQPQELIGPIYTEKTRNK